MLDTVLREAGVPQYQAEEELKSGVGSLSRLLNGDREPGLALAVRIRDKYGIPVEAWLKEYKAPKRRAELLPLR